MTTFILDPRVLDDCVGDSVSDIELATEAFAYFRDGENNKPSYIFYLTSVDDNADLPVRGLDLFRKKYDGHHGDYSLSFQKANLVFMPVSDGDKYHWGSHIKGSHESYLKSCEVLHVRGKFLKGDAEKFKQYGIGIL